MNKRTTKRALFMSFVSMFLCFTMLLGTTYAWFTDSVTSATNQIVAGNLDVELYYGSNNDVVDSQTKLFGKDLNGNDIIWEPGAMVYENLTVANKGTLALKYQLTVNLTNATATASGKTLAEVLKIAVVEDGFSGDREAAKSLTYNDDFKTFVVNGNLEAGDADKTYGIVIYWEPSVNDNDYNMNNGQNVNNGVFTPLSIDIGVNLFATQMEAENDSFDEHYDKEASVPVKSEAVDLPANGEQATESETFTTPSDKGATVKVPAEVLNTIAAHGTEKVALSQAEAIVYENEKKVVVPYMDFVDQDGNKIDLEHLGNDKPITVTFDVSDAFNDGEEVVIYHDDEYVATVIVTNGKVTYTTTHFCEIVVDLGDASIGTNRYGTVAAAFADAEDGDTIVLNRDAVVDANTTINVAKNLVLDLNGKTLAGVSNKTGANRSVIVVGKGGDLTVKNGTVTMEHKGDNMGWNNSTNVLEAVSSGKLTIKDATIKNLGGSDMAYAVNIANNGGATLVTDNATIESVNYVALRVFNNADGAIDVDFTNNTVLKSESSPFFVHFWTEADLGAKQAARQAYLNVEFNDTVVERYSGSKSLVRFGFTNAIYYSGTDMTEVVAGSEAALKWALENGKNVLLNNDLSIEANTLVIKGNVTIDLNAKVLSGSCNSGSAHLIKIPNNATLNVYDNSAEKTGKITYAKGTSAIGWVIDLEGKLVLNSGTIELTGSDWSIGYAVDVRPNAWGANYTEPTVFTMNGGKLVSSDGAVRVASSSADTYGNIVASFVMNGGEIEAAWDGIFVQQSNAAYDTLNVELNGGKITSALSPVRVYGPIATSVNSGSAKPMTITIGNAELAISGEMDTSRTWYVDGKIVLGGEMDVATLQQYATINIK